MATPATTGSSTSNPSARISDAIEICWMSMPNACIRPNVIARVIGMHSASTNAVRHSQNPTSARHAPAPHGSTHRESTVYIDEVTRSATASTQWLLEGADEDGTHPITAHNVIRLLMCGEEAFLPT